MHPTDRNRLHALVAAAVLLGGSLAASAQRQQVSVLSQLTWFTRSGTTLGKVGPVADHGNIELSPDGTRVAVAVMNAAASTRDVWIYDVKTGGRTRFTSDAAEENWMLWSPDGTRTVVNSLLPGRSRLLESPARAFTPREVVATDGGGAWPVSWSPDGRVVLYVTNSQSTGNDIWMAPLDGTVPSPFQHTTASENWAAFSPSGTWVAFSSTAASEVPDVFVTRFPGGGPSWRISTDGGTQARWRRDGKEIVYLAPDRTLVAASLVEQDGRISVSKLESLFKATFPYGAYHAFDLSADGTRILVNVAIGAGGPIQQARAN
jgi:dipeptidyl aminopeptidase/acylaminoacyl peptidase